jgi:hypothetical protein
MLARAQLEERSTNSARFALVSPSQVINHCSCRHSSFDRPIA